MKNHEYTEEEKAERDRCSERLNRLKETLKEFAPLFPVVKELDYLDRANETETEEKIYKPKKQISW